MTMSDTASVRYILPPEDAIPLGDVAKEAVAEAMAETPHQCPECARRFGSKAGLGRHRSSTHGVPGASSKAVKRAAKKGPAKKPPKVKAPEPALDVDDIFLVVAEMFFPQSVPTSALPALIEWRAATQKLLDHLPPS